MRIGLTTIYVNDVAKAFDFYTNTLGFIERTYVPEAQLAIVTSAEDPDGPALLLEPNRNAMTKAYQEGMHSARMPAAAFSVADLAEEYKRLKGLGVKFLQAPSGDGRMPIVFEDTCGNLIQLVQGDAAMRSSSRSRASKPGAGLGASLKAGWSRAASWIAAVTGGLAERARELLGERGATIGAWAMLVIGALVVLEGVAYYLVSVITAAPDWAFTLAQGIAVWALPVLVVVQCILLAVLGRHVARILAVDVLVYGIVLLAFYIWWQAADTPATGIANFGFMGLGLVLGPLVGVVAAIAGIVTARRLLSAPAPQVAVPKAARTRARAKG